MIHLRSTIRLQWFFVLWVIGEDCVSLSAIAFCSIQLSQESKCLFTLDWSANEPEQLAQLNLSEKLKEYFIYSQYVTWTEAKAKRQLFALHAHKHTHMHINLRHSLIFNHSFLLWENWRKKNLTFLKCGPHCAKLYLIQVVRKDCGANERREISVDKRKSEFKRKEKKKKLMHKREATVNKLWLTIICIYV